MFLVTLSGFLNKREEGNGSMIYSKRLKITSVGKVAIISFTIKRPIRYGTLSNKFKTLMNSHPA